MLSGSIDIAICATNTPVSIDRIGTTAPATQTPSMQDSPTGKNRIAGSTAAPTPSAITAARDSGTGTSDKITKPSSAGTGTKGSRCAMLSPSAR